jgi:hypothetical protein
VDKPEQVILQAKPVEKKPLPESIPVSEMIKPEPKPEPVEKPKPIAKPEPKPEIKPVEKPKPEPVKPVVKPEPVKPEPKPEPVITKPEPEPKAPVIQEPVAKEPVPVPSFVPSQEAKGMALSFYGHSLDIPFDQKLKTYAARPLSSQNIAMWWETVAAADVEKTSAYFRRQVEKMKIGDWGFVNLTERFAAKLLGDVPERKMLVWFILNKSGYNAKLGYTKEGTTKVLMPADKQLYGVTYYTFSGIRYYEIDIFGAKESMESLYTYNGKYPKADKILKLSQMQYPDLGFSGFSRDLKFNADGGERVIKAVANKYNIAYLNNFPQADIAVYTGANTPEWMDQTVLPELRKLIKGKSSREAVNILLKFVQTAFEYKTDDQQFGREKFLFAEETLYYPYSDCEDRSVLFSYLVGKLLNLDMVMLDFPGHIAAAVNLGKENTGAMVEYKGAKYTVTDPTYINATAGMIMAQYKNTSPEIIEPEFR